MEPVRKSFQGVINIVRFNWHFYVISAVIAFALIMAGFIVGGFFEVLTVWAVGLLFLGNYISLFASWYIYDNSNLYKLTWLGTAPSRNVNMLNIHAGFDETSELLKQKFPSTNLTVFDFYDPQKHTEVSIKRARKAYPPFPGTISIETSKLPIGDQTVDVIFLTLAAHEIRNTDERNVFFKELTRVLTPSGQIILTEHLRDLPNFMVYNIGFLHFMSKEKWRNSFQCAGLTCQKEIKITPFITSFILQKQNGTTS